MSKKELINLIKLFEAMAPLMNRLLKETYKEDISPILAYTKHLIPRSGFIETDELSFKYQFHGRGCKFMLGDKIIDINYYGDEFTYQGFSSGGLYRFYETSSKGPILGREEFYDLFNKLKDQGFIGQKIPPLGTYYLK
ncbi:DUF6896 domain-containing protein [Saprospira grandis]|uniref:DUF6896 domain-containing protein n=1 Tax=Saprospira grandis (strain Lewin) TaxID=984262 RepID=H6L1W2_SAPGL|nr:hypothetical protein [Saprospira grandis]AFC26190.1 hypothetical protein SGRA_3466 [Saprospira grandis str. Lewin]